MELLLRLWNAAMIAAVVVILFGLGIGALCLLADGHIVFGIVLLWGVLALFVFVTDCP